MHFDTSKMREKLIVVLASNSRATFIYFAYTERKSSKVHTAHIESFPQYFYFVSNLQRNICTTT